MRLRPTALMLPVMLLAACAPSYTGTGPPAVRTPGGTLYVVHIDGESMVPTLANGTLALADRSAYASAQTPQLGDIVVFALPSDPTQALVERVIGLPGDVIEIDGSHTPTQVLIKPGGKGAFEVLTESYLPDAWTALDYCCSSGGQASAAPDAYTIPNDEYFVLGDNRNFSSDSRVFGPVPYISIVGEIISVEGSGRDLYSTRPTLTPA